MNAWSEDEEKAFQQIITAGHLERMQAIRLFRRCRCNLAKALAIAKTNAPEIARNKAAGEERIRRDTAKRSDALLLAS
jgi:hypothetical protein